MQPMVWGQLDDIHYKVQSHALVLWEETGKNPHPGAALHPSTRKRNKESLEELLRKEGSSCRLTDVRVYFTLCLAHGGMSGISSLQRVVAFAGEVIEGSFCTWGISAFLFPRPVRCSSELERDKAPRSCLVLWRLSHLFCFPPELLLNQRKQMEENHSAVTCKWNKKPDKPLPSPCDFSEIHAEQKTVQ